MSATDFDAGDLVLVKEEDPTTLQEGDIIAYQSQNAENYGATVTHKIRSKTTDANGNPGFITYGTTTDVNDETIVTYPFILGKYTSSLPKVGTFFQFLKTPQGYIVCILIPFLLLIIYQGLNCVKIFRMYKAEQMAELQHRNPYLVTLTIYYGESDSETYAVVLNETNQYKKEVIIRSTMPLKLCWEVSWFVPDNTTMLGDEPIYIVDGNSRKMDGQWGIG